MNDRIPPAPQSDDDSIVATRPHWMPVQRWRQITAATVAHIDELLASAQVCPDATPWCRRHDENVCWSRSILVGETHLDIAMAPDEPMTLYGLNDFEDASVDLDTARQIAAAITELLEEVGR